MDARANKDFALADKFRDELLQAGFEVVDTAEGYELREKKPYITLAYPRDIRPINLESDVTVGIIVDGFTDDALETVKTVKANSDCAVAIISIGDAGRLVEQMDTRTYREKTYKKEDEKQEIKKCHSFLTQFYKNYKSL